MASLIDKIITENARKVQNQDDYQKNYRELVLRFENTKMELDKFVKEIIERRCKKNLVRKFLRVLENQDLIVNFNEELWHSLIESIRFYKNMDKKVKFLD